MSGDGGFHTQTEPALRRTTGGEEGPVFYIYFTFSNYLLELYL